MNWKIINEKEEQRTFFIQSLILSVSIICIFSTFSLYCNVHIVSLFFYFISIFILSQNCLSFLWLFLFVQKWRWKDLLLVWLLCEIFVITICYLIKLIGVNIIERQKVARISRRWDVGVDVSRSVFMSRSWILFLDIFILPVSIFLQHFLEE